MVLKEMFRVVLILFILIRNCLGTIDINLPEYQYLADHLTERECRQLVTALHFKEFKLPKRLDDAGGEIFEHLRIPNTKRYVMKMPSPNKRIKRLFHNTNVKGTGYKKLQMKARTTKSNFGVIPHGEQKLPRDVSCVNLLLHWNSLPRGGKGETHVEISHRLSQIGRQDLAVWLTETVFHQLSNDLKNSLTSPRVRKSPRKFCTTENYPDDAAFIDEAAWWKLDTFLSTVLVLGMTTCFVGAIFLCYLCLTRNQNYN